MKKQKLSLLLSIIFVIAACTGCSFSASGTDRETSTVEERIAEETTPVLEGHIETGDELPGGELTVPSYLQGEETGGFFVVEQTDESATYELDGQQQTQLVRQAAEQIQDSIGQVLSDKKYYPHITGISVNEDCSEFHVTFSGTDINTYETTLQMSLYLAGDKYQLYQGKSADELLTVVNYVEESTGKVFSSGDSSAIH